MATHSFDLDEYVEQKIKSGEFRSREEFIEKAIRIYRDLEKLKKLRREIEIGIAQLDRGESAPLDMDSILEEALGDLDERGNPL